VDGVTYPLAEPFMVIATQNPVDQAGTYPLPDSQMDRFIIRSGIGYPPDDIEKEIFRHGSIRDDLRNIPTLVSTEDILEARQAVKEGVYISEKVTEYIFAIVAMTRNHPLIVTGISTRGGINLVEAAKANAYLEGREYVAPGDVQAIATPVGSHRLICRTENENLNKEELLGSILKKIPVPLV
jgi:MoxR-like ATPase